MKLTSIFNGILLALAAAQRAFAAPATMQNSHYLAHPDGNRTDDIAFLTSPTPPNWVQPPAPGNNISLNPGENEDDVDPETDNKERPMRARRSVSPCGFEELERSESIVSVGGSGHDFLVSVNKTGLNPSNSLSCCVIPSSGASSGHTTSISLGSSISNVEGVSNIVKVSDDAILVAVSTSSGEVHLVRLKIDTGSNKPKIVLEEQSSGPVLVNIDTKRGASLALSEDKSAVVTAIHSPQGSFEFNKCPANSLSSCDSSKQSWLYNNPSTGKFVSAVVPGSQGSDLVVVYWPHNTHKETFSPSYFKVPFADLNAGGTILMPACLAFLPTPSIGRALQDKVRFAATNGNNSVMVVAQPVVDSSSISQYKNPENTTLSFVPAKLICSGAKASDITTTTHLPCKLTSMHLVHDRRNNGSDVIAAIVGEDPKGNKVYYISKFSPASRMSLSKSSTEEEYKAALVGVGSNIPTAINPAPTKQNDIKTTADSSAVFTGARITTVGATEPTNLSAKKIDATNPEDLSFPTSPPDGKSPAIVSELRSGNQTKENSMNTSDQKDLNPLYIVLPLGIFAALATLIFCYARKFSKRCFHNTVMYQVTGANTRSMGVSNKAFLVESAKVNGGALPEESYLSRCSNTAGSDLGENSSSFSLEAAFPVNTGALGRRYGQKIYKLGGDIPESKTASSGYYKRPPDSYDINGESEEEFCSATSSKTKHPDKKVKAPFSEDNETQKAIEELLERIRSNGAEGHRTVTRNRADSNPYRPSSKAVETGSTEVLNKKTGGPGRGACRGGVPVRSLFSRTQNSSGPDSSSEEESVF